MLARMISRNQFLIILCLLLIPFALAAQEKTGNIIGKVTDPEGNPLPGVTVTLSQATIAPITKVTNPQGKFRFLPVLPSTTYQLKLELAGFKTRIETGIAVTADITTDLTLVMEMGALEEVTEIWRNKPVLLAPFIRGVSDSGTDKNGLTPLHMAASKGSKDEAERLIAEGADVNGKTADGWTPLHVAAHEGSLDVAALLLSRGATINPGDETGWTPLHSAAAKGSVEVAELLISKGASVNAKTADGWTPLHAAYDNTNLKVAELLITKGADLKAKTSTGDTPLHYAARTRDKVVIVGVRVNGWTPPPCVTEESSKDLAAMLIAKGAIVNAKAKDGRTPLHNAAEEGSDDVVEILVEKGANVNAKTKNGWTPLMLAEKGGHTDIVELLKKNGAR